MDKMCNKSVAEDLNTTITNAEETESFKNRLSPVFKCHNHTKTKGSHLDSSDYGIPSYQVNHSVKSRTSSKNCNESSETCVLPFTPIFSPIPVASVQFQPPSVHSLGTVAKNVDKSCQSKVISAPNLQVQNMKPHVVFESLGMTDKDISWVSSMATPPPKNVPGSEFNTVEKATFLPEEKFQNIQPRALFSPTLDDDFGCHPIVFTSESDDNDEEYKSNIRLSDVCATFKQLEVKSLDLVQNNSSEKIIMEKDYIISPIIKTKKKKLGSSKKNKKGSLVISPEASDKYDFAVGKNFKSLECEKKKSNSGSNFIEDDSFQSMSFSGIDELCKTLVSEQSNTSVMSKTVNCDKTLTCAKENNILKQFYSTKTTDVYKVSSMDNLHLYAKTLEESDKCILGSCKTNKPLPDTGIVRFDILTNGTTKTDGTKRCYSEINEENDQCQEKKIKKAEENSGWENMKQYLSESQLNVSDGEIFRTVENLEKTLASQESKDSQKLYADNIKDAEALSSQNSCLLKSCTEVSEKLSCVDCTQFHDHFLHETTVNEHNKEVTSYKAPKFTLEESKSNGMTDEITKNTDCLLTMPVVCFTTACGSKVSVSEKALIKARELFRECNENIGLDQKSGACGSDKQIEDSKLEQNLSCSKEVFMKGFSTGSGRQITVSSEALKTAKTFLAECENSNDAPEKFINESVIQCHKNLMQKSGDSMTNGFVTGSGKQIQVSGEALEKAETLMLEFDDNSKEQIFDIKCTMKGFSTGSGKTIQVSERALKKAKVFMAECDKGEEDPLLNSSKKDFKNTEALNSVCDKSIKETLTSLDHPIQKPAKTLGKVKSFAIVGEEKPKGNVNIFKGFSTGSGKTIQISSEALEKAKSLMNNCESELNKTSDKTASEWIGELDCNALPLLKDDTDGKTSDYLNKKAGCSKVCFSTALGSKVKVSNKALEKAKELWSSVENSTEMHESSTFLQGELPLIGFITAGGSKVTVSEAALVKAKERMSEWDEIKPEGSGHSDYITDSLKMKNVSEMTTKTAKPKENVNEVLTTSGIFESDDWDEIIPSWLHVYNTSPSIASERTELSPVVCHEDGKSSKPDREYIIKSPILGAGDRFHRKIKKRKLQFEEEKKSQEQNQTGFSIPSKRSERKSSGKRTSNVTLDFSVPFKKMKFVEGIVVEDVIIKTERAKAREDQERSIKQKRKVKPLVGSHLHRKCSESQMSWKEAVAGSSPEVHSNEFLKSFGVFEDVLQINVENAASCRLKGENYFGSSCAKNVKGFPVGDGCLLILDDDNKFGVEEIKRAFLASSGVQPNLVSNGWVENHFRWIIWKLANYERCFPQYFGGTCLTPNNVMLQLKYRYDREIDRHQRSALKKILERDDTSIKRLVLCVCGIQKVTVGDTIRYKLNLTDGWYSCPAYSDPAMTRLIEEGKIQVGTKLVTQGAILVNCEQGVSPLEINSDVYLKISTNSTRRIRWDAKLGFQKNPENFPISLGSILPQGGQISRIDVIIVRIYPTLYMEKTSDGRHVTRNRRSEEKADLEYRRIQEQRMETICNEIQSEMRKSADLDGKLNKNCLNNFEQVEDLHQLVESSSDPSALKELMSADQRKVLENLQTNQKDRLSRELRDKIEKKLEKEKLSKRNVSEFLRAKIVDFRKPDFNNPAILSVWNLNEDLSALLSEGKIISLMNVTINNSSRLYKPLQINTTRQTQYRQIVRNVKYPARKLTQLKDVSSKVCPAFEEVDIVGMVALIRDVSYGSRLSQVVYLTDLEMNFVGVVFWGSCKDYGWENVLKIPSVVACSNLQWKKNYTPQEVPSLYVNESTVFTENPKHAYLKEGIEILKKSMPQDKTAFLSKCEEDLTAKLEDSKWRTNTSKSSANDSRESLKYRPVNGFESKPTASSTPIKPFTMKMNSDEAEPSPIQRRIEKLQSYGEPPSLIPLLVRNNQRRKFKKKS